MLQPRGPMGSGRGVKHFHQTGKPVTIESDCFVRVEVTDKTGRSRLMMRMLLESDLASLKVN